MAEPSEASGPELEILYVKIPGVFISSGVFTFYCTGSPPYYSDRISRPTLH